MRAERIFREVTGAATGAGVASAVSGLLYSDVSLAVPIVGAVLSVVAMKLFGVLDNPEKPVFESAEVPDSKKF